VGIGRAVGAYLVAVLALAGSVADAKTDDRAALRARLDAVVEAYTPDHGFMGAVLVAEGDHIVIDKGYGQADAEWDIPNAPDVAFRIGSLTKQFTAALVLLLQQDGKLSLGDRLGQRLPDVPATWKDITIA
jgi:CubicO group peptidase (beta-lactamase class C family)